MPWPSYRLNAGQLIPGIGFGSARIPPANTAANVELAIESGFSHLDVAQSYGNEEEVGAGVRDSGISRDHVFITTKWSGKNRGSDARMTPSDSLDQSLKQLGLSWIDLYLCHEAKLFERKLREGWKLFEALQESGRTKSIGLSNFTLEELKELLKNGEKPVKIQPAVLQNPLYLYNWHEQQPIVEYCQSKGIVFEGYSPMAPLTHFPGGPVDKPMNEIAERLGIKPEQVLLAFSRSKGVIPLITSRSKERLEGYIAAGDVILTKEDVHALEVAGRKGHLGSRPSRTTFYARWVLLFVCSIAFGYLFARYRF